MDWSFWFAKKHRGITILAILFFICLGMACLLFWGMSAINDEILSAQKTVAKAKDEALRAKNQYRIWQQNRVVLQQGLFYVASHASHDIKASLKQWQKIHPQRKLRYHIEKNQKDTPWHSAKVRMVYYLVLGFWVKDEEDLSSAWTEKKKTLPCLTITTNMRLSRAEESGIDIEEELVCVQF